MKKISRTFTVRELGKNKPASFEDISLLGTDEVEVLDHLTRSTVRLKAADVSIYRHTLRMQGKSFSLMNVQESLH